ncbi:MAG: NYN domain-containing protein [Chloroflexi bacterium]|nr:NYN domain-containing protein [Chloroflexota bacterium]
MKIQQNNYAFIDGQNVYKSALEIGWKLDTRKFRKYLSDKYGVTVAYYFIGYMEENTALYDMLKEHGYELIYKPTYRIGGTVKGNVDAELVLQAMIDYEVYDKAVIVTSDGDIACLAKYLLSQSKLLCVLGSSKKGCSHLLEQAATGYISYMDELQTKVQFIP